MTPVNPAASAPAAQPVMPQAPAPAAPASGSAGEALVSSSSSSLSLTASSSSSVTMISEEVGGMLGGISESLADNEMLKMIIALLILQAMNGDSKGLEETLGMLGQALGGSGGGGSSSSVMMMSSSSAVSMSLSSETSTAYGSLAASDAYGQNTAPPNAVDTAM